MQLSKVWKIIGGTFITIFIGALSSGLWEEVLKPILNYLAIGIIKIISLIFSSYKDNIYLEISNGFHEAASMFLFILVLVITIQLYIFIIKIYHIKKRKAKQNNINKSTLFSKKIYLMIYFMSIFAIVTLSISIAKTIYVNKIITYSSKSIQIIGPYVESKEFLEIQSQFSRIQSANDFYDFNEHISIIAEKNNIKLPKVSIF